MLSGNAQGSVGGMKSQLPNASWIELDLLKGGGLKHIRGKWSRRLETDSNLLLPQWLAWKPVQGLSSIPNLKRQGGLFSPKRSACQDPRQNRVKSPYSSYGCNLGNVSSRLLPAPLDRCLNVRLPRREDKLSLSPRRGPSSGTREGDCFSTSHSRTLEQTCAIVVLWFVGRKYPCSSLLWN